MNMEQWTDNFGVQFEKDENGMVSLVKTPENIKVFATHCISIDFILNDRKVMTKIL